jgi:thiol-disulfide isomerase/thioredoxin
MSLNSLGFGLGVENLEQQGKQVKNAVDAMNNLVEGGRVAHAMKKSPVMKPHTHSKSPQWIVGKVFAEWCGHCITMKGEWENLKSVMKKEKGGAVEFIEIEDVEMKDRLHEMNQTYFQKGNEKVSSTGFPTVFMFQVANPAKTLDYFVPPSGKRTMSAMKIWIKKNMGDSVSSMKSKSKGGRGKTGKKKGGGNGMKRTKRKWGK